MDIINSIRSELLHHFKTIECSTLSLIGLSAVILCIAIIFKSTVYTPFRLYFLAQYLPGVDVRKLGRWAVITGSTDGIGKGYANALAKKGLDIVLISRSEAKLAKVADDITREYGVQVKTIAVDFTHTDIYSQIQERLSGLDIAILVNNVGVALKPSTFLQTEDRLNTTVELVNVNCVAMTNMCALVLPQMLEKKAGVIVNISSIAVLGYLGGSTYSSTKAYVSKLSECLQRTYKYSGVIIQTVEAGAVKTKMLSGGVTQSLKPLKHMELAVKYASVSPDSFVKSALNTIGWSNHTHGHVLHYMTNLIASIQPQSSQDAWILADLK